MNVTLVDETIIQALMHNLDPTDIAQLRLTCKHFRDLIDEESTFWMDMWSAVFSDYAEVVRQVQSVDFVEDIDLQASVSEWKDAFIEQRSRTDTELDELSKEAEQNFLQGGRIIEEAQNSGGEGIDGTVLDSAMNHFLNAIRLCPNHLSAFSKIIGMCMLVGALDQAMVIADLTEEIEGDRASSGLSSIVNELRNQINRRGQACQSEESDAYKLLIENDQLSTKAAVALSKVFLRFDKDSDGFLNRQELTDFITFAAGQRPSSEFVDMFLQYRETNEKGDLTLDGFLAHYLMQSLDDPDETMNDLCKFGFDPTLDHVDVLPDA
eukprot:Clim_evm14s164 gene=Clim_evmTU14s164